ncbi:HERV-H LTR-associating protein 1 isoform X2 [Seriola aureovittata]|uniref:HERV-H LTR-associating protein 1 isoform X2 n=2 Tax=Seriola aureovittata TaxID=2871759 RepID=UPI0024BE6F96|nr:HERV-H LTR-associating protein 1 isoform X2 [Seriola aureovittata]
MTSLCREQRMFCTHTFTKDFSRTSGGLQQDFSRAMAGLQRATHYPRLCFIICATTILLLILFSQALRHRQKEDRHRRDILDTTEIPAELIDPAAIDLTPLVNTLINSSQSGSRQLFSLLSVTSYSSLALHKLTLLVYNISSIRSVESNLFRRRFCYCVTNETNDLTDFTAILLDVIGNSTSYLHELFKSTSILSVSQRNNSDCIYICVMAGKMGREVPELWEVASITPLFNQTIVEGPHRAGNISSFSLPVEWHQLPTNLSHISPSGMSSMLTSRVHSTAHVSPSTMEETAAPTAEITTAQLPATAQQPPTVAPQSETTADRLETTVGTTQTVMEQRVTSRGATKPDVTTAQSQATQKPTTTTAVLQPTSTPPVTTVSLTAAASTTRLTTVTSSPVISLSQMTTASHLLRTMTQHTTSTAHPTRLSPARPTAGATVASWTTGPLSWRTTTPSKSVETERPGCPWRRPELTGESVSSSTTTTTTTTTVSAHKLQPCVLELCKFFSQCLCRPFNHKTRMKRYCDDSHLWYEKHTSEVCRRVRRVSFSRNLKQRCLTKMCNKL